MNNNILTLLTIIVFVVFIYIYQELDDMRVVNNEYKKILSNSTCMKHIQLLNAYPWWRICVAFGLLNTLILGGFVKQNINDQKAFWNILWFSLLLNILVIYKFIAHWQWHYVSNDGGLSNSEFTSK